jgi:hypothetical protein
MKLLSMPLLINSPAEVTHVAWRLYEKGLMRGLSLWLPMVLGLPLSN